MAKHAGEGTASNEGRDHYVGRHARTEPGYAAGGQISDRIRSTPDLLALELEPGDRGESTGPYDKL